MDKRQRRIAVKQVARIQLAGNWLKGGLLIAISALFAMFCSNFIPLSAPSQPINAEMIAQMNMVEVARLFVDMLVPDVITTKYLIRILISVVLFLLVIPAFEQGIKLYFCKVYAGEKPKISVAFSWYTDLSKIFGAIGLYIYIGILSALWMVLILALPLAAIAISSITHMLLLEFMGVLAYIVGVIFIAIKLIAYMPAYYIYAKDPSVGVFAAVRTSVQITKGRLVETFVFRLSFILWDIFASLIQTVGEMIFKPYYHTACAGYVDLLIKEKAMQEENTEN